jgi:hypothetical protein
LNDLGALQGSAAIAENVSVNRIFLHTLYRITRRGVESKYSEEANNHTHACFAFVAIVTYRHLQWQVYTGEPGEWGAIGHQNHHGINSELSTVKRD